MEKKKPKVADSGKVNLECQELVCKLSVVDPENKDDVYTLRSKARSVVKQLDIKPKGKKDATD